MNVKLGTCRGILVLRVMSPRIDATFAPEFKKVLGDLAQRGLSSFVIDLSAVDFVDSTGLAVLVSALKVAGKPGGVVVAGARGAVATLFKLTRMDKVFRLFPTDAEAAAAMTTGTSA